MDYREQGKGHSNPQPCGGGRGGRRSVGPGETGRTSITNKRSSVGRSSKGSGCKCEMADPGCCRGGCSENAFCLGSSGTLERSCQVGVESPVRGPRRGRPSHRRSRESSKIAKDKLLPSGRVDL